ncbi:unnamed protein product [Penicillium nalgiovense]|uniref:AAA+ ATPase domain-containing protein n=1 Tax=Penicillium nalgiovense TaxID=60175 RepID=A0A9W4HCV2_PENNA|nr:unnamed protein product [Penicillium nalgiovense]CAG7941560.1 unnamed protein product [Penicillium nalgiovense]CAG7969978.1 unnamed protein product [Penicillium nalgiovense]CAG7981904.1 unnamed protein product [Penicillium nalgiovense]CAG8021356.1 unnamed protein product [Penicillium nalgiovense]
MLIIQEDVSSNHRENQEFADRYWSISYRKNRSVKTNIHFSNRRPVLTYAELQFDEALQLLSAPDPSINHRTAYELYEPTTCSWLVNSERFNRWLNSPSILLLSGIPGCGKTVLCSAAIERVRSHVIGKSGVGLVYFYFDFHEEQKQSVEGLLLSVIVQLVYQQEKLPVQFRSLCDDFKERRGKLRGEKLLKALHATIEQFRRVYLILDALDECGEQQGVMSLIANLVRSHAGFSILATSRDTTEISRSALGQVSTNVIYMSLDNVNIDIRTYVVNSLSRDPKLRERPSHVKAEIEAALTSGSHGMFRWVECQLQCLRSCLTLTSVRETLRSMPKTLTKTYDMILARIDTYYQKQAYEVLQWLAFAVRPLRLAEIAETLIIKPGVIALSEEDRLFSEFDILTIGSSLIRISNGDEVRLAHYSVKEYLMSSRLKSTALSSFHIAEQPANQYLAHACVTYLLLLNRPERLSLESFTKLPLLNYAATHWQDHANIAFRAGYREESTKNFLCDILRLMDQRQGSAYLNWLRVSDPDDWNLQDLSKREQDVPKSLYYASLLGLYIVTEALINRGVDVNARGGLFGNALQAAAFQNHHQIVYLLLQNGAEIKLNEGLHYSALNAAAVNGSEASFRILFDSCFAGRCNDSKIVGSSLVAAAASGNVEIVTLLLDHGADVNFRGNDSVALNSILAGSPIAAASFQGHKDVVQLLIAWGADVNAKGGRYGNPLQTASRAGFDCIVELLLDYGADVNAQGGVYKTALQAASASGHQSTVRLLLERDANDTS